MSWNITVLTPHGRRHAAKYTPDTTVLQVLEQTCKKYEFNSDEYDLMHHNKVLDTKLTLRFSGLPNNASLEMTPVKKARVESDVIVGLQLENGNRLMGTFKPSTSVYDVLVTLAPEESDVSLNPVVIYTRKEIFGLEPLQGTSLKSLGLTGGRAILRLIHRTPEQLRVQANVSAPLPHKPKEEETYEPSKRSNPNEYNKSTNIVNLIKDEAKLAERPNVPDVYKPDPEPDFKLAESYQKKEDPILVTFPGESSSIISDETEKKEDLTKEIIFLGERNALVFSQDTITDFKQLDDLPEDFFELSVNEVKKLLSDLRKAREAIENAPLETNLIRSTKTNEEMSKKIRKNERVILRILFPDRTVLQGTFVPVDKIQIVRDFVVSFLENPDTAFDLYVSPPKKILTPEMTLLEAECIPSAVLHFGPHNREASDQSQTNYIKTEILSKFSSPEAAMFSASQIRKKINNQTMEMQVD